MIRFVIIPNASTNAGTMAIQCSEFCGSHQILNSENITKYVKRIIKKNRIRGESDSSDSIHFKVPLLLNWKMMKVTRKIMRMDNTARDILLNMPKSFTKNISSRNIKLGIFFSKKFENPSKEKRK
jgi:hypothetical protein